MALLVVAVVVLVVVVVELPAAFMSVAFMPVAFMSVVVVVAVHVSRREVFIDVHSVVGIVLAAASGNCQGRTRDQDKSTHSKLPIYCDLQRFPVPQIARTIV